MKLLPILFLCLYCFLSDTVPVLDSGVDCDDQIIFNAVDEALKAYNNAKEDGNIFVLFRVTDAKKRNHANGQIHYFLEYEVRESSCTVKSKHSWQDCQFQENKPEWGQCSAHVLENTEKTIQTVVSQNCNISKEPLEPHVIAVYHQCLGCATPISTDNKDIQSFVHIAIEKMNKLGSHLYYFDLDQIVNATRQVVRGWDYKIRYVVRKTNCSKIDFKTKDSDECTLDKKGETGKCELHVSVYPEGQVNDILLTCTSQAGVCLSCPLTVDPEDPELLSLLRQVIDEDNSNNSFSKLNKLSKVSKATKHGFHEQIYEVNFSMMPTNCSKPEYTILGDECGNEEDAYPLSCYTIIHVTDKRIKVHSAPQCMQQLLAVQRISGLSPLRMTQIESVLTNDNLHLFNPKIKQQKSRGKKNRHHKEHKQEQKGNSDIKPHREHKHNHEDEEESSEEVVENGSEANVQEVTAASQQIPHVPSTQLDVPNTDIEETSKLELPALPKCPGKMWQPIRLTTTAKPLTDDDLALAAADFNPLPDKEEEGKPKTPKQIEDFSDDDLLI